MELASGAGTRRLAQVIKSRLAAPGRIPAGSVVMALRAADRVPSWRATC
jgi:hypothetical protein